MNNSLQKDHPIAEDFKEVSLDENHCLKKLLHLVGENKQVIHFGCATDYFPQLLTKKGCKVTGVELNPNAAKVAAQYCEQVIVADLDLVSLAEILPSRAFDVAVFGDVLEHLRCPWRVLKETQQLLKPDGYVVASIPNIAHEAIRLTLLQGKSKYTEHRILDNTRLRFFTRKILEELFEVSGYFVDIIDRAKLSIFSDASSIPDINNDNFNREIIQDIEKEDEKTLQFILRGFPGAQGDKYTALKERFFKLVDQLERSQSQLQHTQVESQRWQSQFQRIQVESQRSQSQLQHTQAEWERWLSQFQHIQAEFQAESEKLQSRLQHMQAESEKLQSDLQYTQAELERSQSQLQQTQIKEEQLQAVIRGMESSKFWQLRSAWVRLKRPIHTTKMS